MLDGRIITDTGAEIVTTVAGGGYWPAQEGTS
jgi:hypothetical protein